MEFYRSTLAQLYPHFSSSEQGLSQTQAEVNLRTYGPNVLRISGLPWWRKLLAPFLNIFMLVLALAAVISIATHELFDGFIILFIMAVSAVIDYLQQLTSERIFKALRHFDEQTIEVWRGGKKIDVKAEELLPGDVIFLREGQKIPADCRVIESESLRVDESILTGESLPIAKEALEITEVKPIYEQSNMLFSGTFLVSGHTKALVVSTGNATEFGKIANLTADAHQISPVQKKIDRLISQITIAVALTSVIVFGLSMFRGIEIGESIRIVLTLAVSAVPEGLPVAISVVLVLGARQLAKHRALIRNLSAIENIGIITTIATDKTGTLTKNKLRVQQARTFTGADETHLRQAAYLAINRQNSQLYDPLDVALEQWGSAPEMNTKVSLVEHYPFNQQLAMSGVAWSEGDGYTIYIKGAPEKLLHYSGLTKSGRADYESALLSFTQDGFRAIAIATLRVKSLHGSDLEQLLEQPLTLIGLLAVADELREEAKDSIAITQSAGVSVRMITGDHFETAYAIGRQLGLVSSRDEVFDCRQMDALNDADLAPLIQKTKVFSRVLPEYKHRILSQLKNSEITAMTGDGVNDVPALTNAHIGIAMGSGSQIAKEAGDIVLLDDNFASIVSALRQGRIVFDNIQRMLFYLLSTNAGEVLTMLGALLIGLPIPILPVQILWINLVTDSTLVIPLGVETAEDDVMRRNPRNPQKPILGRAMIMRIMLIALVMAAVTIGVFIYYWQTHSTAYARTLAFNVLVVMQWANAFNARSEWKSIMNRNIFANTFFYLAIVASVGIQLAALFTPVAELLHLGSVAVSDLLLTSLMGMGLIILVVELHKLIGRRQGKLE